ncbi:MAG: ACP S-malonyltransferase [Deltaproteobacteria bacterium]|nr:ACP S-malonyltransferase [Deltaproteobacteria bacterium]
MPEKIAFLFPGQGSQYIGMCKDLAEEYPEVMEIFRLSDDICNKPISRLCFEGPMDELTLTVNLQPAITAASLACFVALSKNGLQAFLSAGHSLGEYSALVSAGAISISDAISLVNKRGELMHRECRLHPGAMSAVMGMNIHEVAEIVKLAEQRGIISVANHNTAEQIVITGEKDPIDYAGELVKERGKKAIPLKVSGAWHCALMKDAVDDFREFIESAIFSSPKAGMLFNATAEKEHNPERIKDIMAQQLVNPVKWYDIIVKMIDYGVDTFVEVGPKKVLSGLVKKILPQDTEAVIYNVEDKQSLQRFLNR